MRRNRRIIFLALKLAVDPKLKKSLLEDSRRHMTPFQRRYNIVGHRTTSNPR